MAEPTGGGISAAPNPAPPPAVEPTQPYEALPSPVAQPPPPPRSTTSPGATIPTTVSPPASTHIQIKRESEGNTLPNISAALSKGLSESLFNALKRSRPDEDEGNAADSPTGGDIKRTKTDLGAGPATPRPMSPPVALPVPETQSVPETQPKSQPESRLESQLETPSEPQAVPPEPHAAPASHPLPSSRPASELETGTGTSLNIEAMLKSALGNLNSQFSTTTTADASGRASGPASGPAPSTSVSSPPPARSTTEMFTKKATPAASPTPAATAPHAPASRASVSVPPLPAPVSVSPSPPSPLRQSSLPITRQPTVTPTREVVATEREYVPSSPRADISALAREPRRMRFAQNPTYIARSMTLPLLGNFAVQLLYCIRDIPTHDLLQDGIALEGEPRRVYKTLHSTFCNMRKLFSESSLMLNTEELDIKEIYDQETILMANMATLCCSIFEANELPLIEVHDNFLMTFLFEPDSLNKDVATLFLVLKHCLLADELMRLPDDEQRGAFLERLFPFDLEEQLKQLHVDAPFSEQEREFIMDMMVAKERLLEAAKTEESRRALKEEYPFKKLRDELGAFLQSYEDTLMRYADSHGIEVPFEEEAPGEEMLIDNILPSAEEPVHPNAEPSALAAMGDSIASMLEAAMASATVTSTPPPPRLLPSSTSFLPTTTALSPSPLASIAESLRVDTSEIPPAGTSQTGPVSFPEGVSRLIQEAVQRNNSRTTPEASSSSPAPATSKGPSPTLAASTVLPASTPPASTANGASTPSTAAPAATSAAPDTAMDISGLTNLIKARLGQDTAQNTHKTTAPSPSPSPAQAPAPNHLAQGQSVASHPNSTLAGLQNAFANNLMYPNRAPAYGFPPQNQQNHQGRPLQQQANTQGGSVVKNGNLPPNQSSPSSILYQQARQAAATKSQVQHIRREGLHSTRRPWSPDEEQALMAGLDMVKGPHWSQILQLFGANGTISDILKDRSQVQLKDKARNLKLFFLKANTEMPYYLQCVTGELKTRAPSQAARKEAEDRARATSKEEQARVQGIMTLAGGLQDKNHGAGAAVAPTTGSASLARASSTAGAMPSPSTANGSATVVANRVPNGAIANGTTSNSTTTNSIVGNGAPRYTGLGNIAPTNGPKATTNSAATNGGAMNRTIANASGPPTRVVASTAAVRPAGIAPATNGTAAAGTMPVASTTAPRPVSSGPATHANTSAASPATTVAPKTAGASPAAMTLQQQIQIELQKRMPQVHAQPQARTQPQTQQTGPKPGTGTSSSTTTAASTTGGAASTSGSSSGSGTGSAASNALPKSPSISSASAALAAARSNYPMTAKALANSGLSSSNYSAATIAASPVTAGMSAAIKAAINSAAAAARPSTMPFMTTMQRIALQQQQQQQQQQNRQQQQTSTAASRASSAASPRSQPSPRPTTLAQKQPTTSGLQRATPTPSPTPRATASPSPALAAISAPARTPTPTRQLPPQSTAQPQPPAPGTPQRPAQSSTPTPAATALTPAPAAKPTTPVAPVTPAAPVATTNGAPKTPAAEVAPAPTPSTTVPALNPTPVSAPAPLPAAPTPKAAPVPMPAVEAHTPTPVHRPHHKQEEDASEESVLRRLLASPPS